jgi:cytochrome c-type biogenesis protein CcmF
VLFGTLAPLIYEAMNWGKISVGFPWFNTMFVAVTPFLALFMGVGQMTRWKHDEPLRLVRELWLAAVAGAGVRHRGLHAPGLGHPCSWSRGHRARRVGSFSHLAGLRERLRHKRNLRRAVGLPATAAATTGCSSRT